MKVTITTAADDVLIFLILYQKKISLDFAFGNKEYTKERKLETWVLLSLSIYNDLPLYLFHYKTELMYHFDANDPHGLMHH